MTPGLLFHLIVFLLPLSLGPPALAGSLDIAAPVASCADVYDAMKLSPDGGVVCFEGRIVPLADVRKLNFGPPAQAGSPDIAALVASCAHVQDAIKLSPDGDVLCFDGRIKIVSLDDVRKLNNGGTFVARSAGGDLVVAMLIADILKRKNATVVLHGYCLSACASAFLVASHETHVARWTIVAWPHGDGALNLRCPPLAEYLMQDGDAEGQSRMEGQKSYCLDPQPVRTFYRRRGIKEDFARQPQTHYSRQMLHAMRRGAVDKRPIFWMWNPENFGSYFKSKITFQSFPRSQEQVNQLLRDLRFDIRVVYDPPENER